MMRNRELSDSTLIEQHIAKTKLSNKRSALIGEIIGG
jgi:hypothetical protein